MTETEDLTRFIQKLHLRTFNKIMPHVKEKYPDATAEQVKEIIKSLVITLMLIMLLIFIVFILVFGGKIINLVGQIPQIGFIGAKILTFINLFRWPISFIIIFLFIKMIYTLTPNKKISSKSVNKGSLFTTVLWIILTYSYSLFQ